jgi:actin-like ATPase involved in cell morphogenesis
MNLSKARKLKVNVMRALQQNEDSEVKKGILGALIEDELTEEVELGARDVADATRQLAQGVTAALPAPEVVEETPQDAPSAVSEEKADTPAPDQVGAEEKAS